MMGEIFKGVVINVITFIVVVVIIGLIFLIGYNFISNMISEISLSDIIKNLVNNKGD
jgi:hypothetical protein